jgi:NitT/TauT family transport system ATP-binding protein
VPVALGTGNVKIRVEGAARTFVGGAVIALAGVNLEIYENEIACIVGPSGCGKTTLLRCLDGLVPLSEGTVRIDDRVVTRPPKNVAVVFQHFGLFPWKTVSANTAYGLKLAGATKDTIEARVSRVLKLVGLAGFEKAYPYQLSGGMQQRVGLARALATEPEILLMDEPFASLDAQTREILQEETLRILEEERKTIVFITHSIDEAILLGDRVIVMTARPGRVKQILPVPFPRPRRLAAVRADPAFGELRARLWDQLRQEIH